MTNILIICGYGLSGKTTFISELKEENWSVASTSQILDDLSYAFVDAFGDKVGLDLVKKKGKAIFGNLSLNPREFKIAVAEQVIVPALGRQALVQAAFDKAKKNNIVHESIGGEELDLSLKYIRSHYKTPTVLVINFRSSIELPGVDIRKLATQEQCGDIPVVSFTNYFIGYDGLKCLIREYFNAPD